MFEEVGKARFSTAVDLIIRDGKYQFFPSVAEFRSYIPDAVRRPYCGECADGWRYVPDFVARKMYSNTDAMAVVRCECRRTA